MTEDAKPEQTAVNGSRTAAASDTRLTRGRSRPVRPGCVYFIRRGDTIKIGTTKDLKRRLSGLQTSHSEPLELMAAISDDRIGEFETHEQFAHLRIRGEWFRAEPELLEFIETTKSIVGEIPSRRPPPPPGIRVAIRRLRKQRNMVGAETREGRLLSNLALQTAELADYVQQPWATHPMQTLQGMMDWQIKLLAAGYH